MRRGLELSARQISGVAIVLLALAVAQTLQVALRSFDFTVDDAFISMRYALHLAEGDGLRFNRGDPPVEGYSNFLWTLLMAAPLALGVMPLTLLKLLGLGCAIATIVLTYHIVLRLGGDRLAAGAAALVLGVDSYLAVWSIAGLETPLFVALLPATTLLVLVQDGSRQRRVALAAALLATGLVRLEGPLYAAVLAAVALWREPDRRGLFLHTLLPSGLLYVGYTLWRVIYFGSLVPNVAAAKLVTDAWSSPVVRGSVYLGEFLLSYAALLLLGVVSLLLARRHAIAWGLAGVAAVATLLTARVIPHAAEGFRLLLPVVWASACLGGLGLASTRALRWRLVLGAALVAALGSALWPRTPRYQWATDPAIGWFRPFRNHVQAYTTSFWGGHIAFAEALRRRAAPDCHIAATDIGAVGFLGGLRVTDLFGLTDPEMVRRRGDAKAVLDRRPDLIVLIRHHLVGSHLAWEQALHADAGRSRDYVLAHTYDGPHYYFYDVYVAASSRGRCWKDL